MTKRSSQFYLVPDHDSVKFLRSISSPVEATSAEPLRPPTGGELDIATMDDEDARAWRRREKWRERNKATRAEWVSENCDFGYWNPYGK
jgi:hypothetical protein